MRIALVNSEFSGPGGIGSYTASMARSLTQNGHTVHVLQKSGLAKIALPGITEHVVGRVVSKNALLRPFAYRFLWEVNLHLEYARSVHAIFCELSVAKHIDI